MVVDIPQTTKQYTRKKYIETKAQDTDSRYAMYVGSMQ